jgi:hypothetical protein
MTPTCSNRSTSSRTDQLPANQFFLLERRLAAQEFDVRTSRGRLRRRTGLARLVAVSSSISEVEHQAAYSAVHYHLYHLLLACAGTDGNARKSNRHQGVSTMSPDCRGNGTWKVTDPFARVTVPLPRLGFREAA